MTVRGAGLLIALWCAVLIAGCFLAGAVSGGAQSGVVIGGYLVQFAIYMVLARMTDHTTTFSWALLASLLFFAVAVAVATSLAGAIVSPVAVVAAGYWMFDGSYGRDRLSRRGYPAVGVVVQPGREQRVPAPDDAGRGAPRRRHAAVRDPLSRVVHAR